jgi:hypothetical protein
MPQSYRRMRKDTDVDGGKLLVSPRQTNGSGSGSSGEGTSMYESPANTQNDTQGHAGCEDCSHGRDDGLNAIVDSGGFHGEPEEHIDHVDDPNHSIEVEPVAEHKFPEGDGFGGARLEGAREGESE